MTEPVRAAAWKAEGAFVYLVCPACEHRMYEPFSRFDLPRFVRHQFRRSEGGTWVACDAPLVVTVDPAGDCHEVRVLARPTDAEPTLLALYRERRTVQRLLAAVYALTEATA